MEGSPRTLAGRYRLEEIVGRGGMSTVYRARDLLLDRTVAVKVLLDVLATEDRAYVARFEREARAAAALANPAVVTVYDTGVDGSTRFIVMEYVEGKSVATMLHERGALGVDEAVQVAAAVAGALASAHGAGILHRDIKPGNVMVSPSGQVKVLDFGIARPVSEATVTHAHSLLGTVAYMAPERASGASGDERSDLYSLGCLLYAMLTGSPPFTGDLAAAVLHQHLSAAPRRLGQVIGGVPPALDALAAELLAKDPRDRPQTAAETRDRLAALSGEPTAATALVGPTAATALVGSAPAPVPVGSAGTRRPAAAPELAGVNRAMPQPRIPSGVPILGTLLAAIILIAGISVLLASGGGKSTATKPPSHSTRTSKPTKPRATTPKSTTSTSTSTSTVTLTRTSTPTTATHPAQPATPAAPGPKTGGRGVGNGGTPPGQAKKH